MPEPTTSTGAANALAFDQPLSRVIARGLNIERWLRDGQAEGTGGIANPQPARMPTGQYYYRFASSGSSRDAQFGGGWWIDFENFAQIRQFALAHGYRLHEAARLMLALPYAWTQVDLLVRALLVKPLRAWAGAGKPAQGGEAGADRGTLWIPTQHIRVCQLYVPGLTRHHDGGRMLYETAFEQPVSTQALLHAQE